MSVQAGRQTWEYPNVFLKEGKGCSREGRRPSLFCPIPNS